MTYRLASPEAIAYAVQNRPAHLPGRLRCHSRQSTGLPSSGGPGSHRRTPAAPPGFSRFAGRNACAVTTRRMRRTATASSHTEAATAPAKYIPHPASPSPGVGPGGLISRNGFTRLASQSSGNEIPVHHVAAGVISHSSGAGPTSRRPSTRYVSSSAWYARRTQIDSTSASVQPTDAVPTVTRNDPSNAPGSIPPSSPARASTGTPLARTISTGVNRAASFPSTISSSVRSVTSRCSSVPRDFSTQIDPAITAGAASITSINWSSPSLRKKCSLIEAVRPIVRILPLERHPDHRQAEQQHGDVQRPQRIHLPPPRPGEPFVREDRPEPPPPRPRHGPASAGPDRMAPPPHVMGRFLGQTSYHPDGTFHGNYLSMERITADDACRIRTVGGPHGEPEGDPQRRGSACRGRS